jgi:hypothetical protein
MNAMEYGSNAYIDGIAAIAVGFVSLFPVAALAFGTVFVIAGLVEFFGFGRGIDGALQQGLRHLNIGHDFGDDILWQRIGDDRWR